MVSFRIYRAGFAPALVAVVVLLFALTGPPDPLPGVVAPAEFDEVAAGRMAREIIETAPERAPGSEGDAQVADMVQKRFEQAEGGEVTEQRFTAEFEGDDVDLRNVILTLPGDSARTVVLLAPRDSATGPGAASSAAATATLLELVDEMRTQSHTKTLVFVSTDGSSAGAAGAREFAQGYPERDEIDAAIDLWQPGSANPRQPFLLTSSDGAQSPPAQLVRTAERELADQTQLRQEVDGTLGELAGLALPSGLGEQAVLIESGLQAIGLSSAGERPLPASQDQADDLSASTMGDLGRTALLLAATVDAAPTTLDHGPGTYVPLAGNLVPGWTLAFLALTLLFPAGLAAGDAALRRRNQQRHQPVSGASAPSPSHPQRHQPVSGAMAWAASRALPLLAALLLFYLLALVGLVARPPFPFDPNLFGVGAGQVIVMVLLALVAGGSYYAIRGWRVPATLSTSTAVPALGLVSTLAVFIAWLANPYLGLLLVPTAHVWLTCTPRRGALPWPLVAVAAVVSLLPFLAAVDHLSGALDLGAEAPWLLLLMVSDGQLGFGTMVALCLVVGALLGVLAVSLRQPPPVGRTSEALDTFPITSAGSDDDLRIEGQQPRER